MCREIAVDIADHRSQGITDELLAWADHVLVMELAHARYVRENHDLGDRDVLVLGTFGGLYEIADPVGAWTFTFRRIRRQIESCVDAFLARVA